MLTSRAPSRGHGSGPFPSVPGPASRRARAEPTPVAIRTHTMHLSPIGPRAAPYAALARRPPAFVRRWRAGTSAAHASSRNAAISPVSRSGRTRISMIDSA